MSLPLCSALDDWKLKFCGPPQLVLAVKFRNVPVGHLPLTSHLKPNSKTFSPGRKRNFLPTQCRTSFPYQKSSEQLIHKRDMVVVAGQNLKRSRGGAGRGEGRKKVFLFFVFWKSSETMATFVSGMEASCLINPGALN